MEFTSYKDLNAWKESMALVKLIYTITRTFPQEERFGLTNQIRRAVVSIPSNIAEGRGRYSTAEFINFLSIAHGSLNEVETQLEIALMLEFVDMATYNEIIAKCAVVGKLIVGLIKSLKQR